MTELVLGLVMLFGLVLAFADDEPVEVRRLGITIMTTAFIILFLLWVTK